MPPKRKAKVEEEKKNDSSAPDDKVLKKLKVGIFTK
jgi:hypothetical protein